MNNYLLKLHFKYFNPPVQLKWKIIQTRSSKRQTSSLTAVWSWTCSKSFKSLLMFIIEWCSQRCRRNVCSSIISMSGIKISTGSWYWMVVSRALLTTGNIEAKRKLFECTVPFEQFNVTSWWHLVCDWFSTSNTIKSLE